MVCVPKLCVKDGVSKMVGDEVSEAPATQNERGGEIVPRLPREIKVDVTQKSQKWRGATGVTPA